MPETCASCGKSCGALRCSLCKVMCYCNVACQRAHWKQGHKASCKGSKSNTAPSAGSGEEKQAMAICKAHGVPDWWFPMMHVECPHNGVIFYPGAGFNAMAPIKLTRRAPLLAVHIVDPAWQCDPGQPVTNARFVDILTECIRDDPFTKVLHEVKKLPPLVFHDQVFHFNRVQWTISDAWGDVREITYCLGEDWESVVCGSNVIEALAGGRRLSVLFCSQTCLPWDDQRLEGGVPCGWIPWLQDCMFTGTLAIVGDYNKSEAPLPVPAEQLAGLAEAARMLGQGPCSFLLDGGEEGARHLREMRAFKMRQFCSAIGRLSTEESRNRYWDLRSQALKQLLAASSAVEGHCVNQQIIHCSDATCYLSPGAEPGYLATWKQKNALTKCVMDDDDDDDDDDD